MLWMAFCLALVLIAAKAGSLGMPHSWRWLLDLAQASNRDVLFALGFAAVGALGARAFARRVAWVRRAMLAAGAFFAFYSIVAYGVFESFDRPLSFDLLRLMRGAAVKSSITDRLTVPIVVAMAAAPLAFLLAATRTLRHRAVAPCIAGFAAVWIATGMIHQPDAESGKRSQRLTLSPHVELLRSAFVGLSGHRIPTLPRDFLPEDLDEVRPFGSRQPAPRTGFAVGENVARPRNVIVVVLESVGAKYLGLHGSRYATTPHLVEEAKHALILENAYAHAPYTFCTFLSVNFSIYPGLPWRYGPGSLTVGDGGPRALPPTLASVLQPRGWRTAYLHNGDMEWGGQKYLLTNGGYDTMEDYRDFKAPELSSWGAEDRFLFDRLIQWIDEKPGAPFLAYCWTDQTHSPYLFGPGMAERDFFQGQPPRRLAEDLGKFLNVVHNVDAQLGRLFAALRERGIAEDTIVVITGDHGEAFADPHDSICHGFSIFEEDVHVPFMIWNPRLFSGERRANVGGHVDLNPTLADLLGVEPLDQWQGHSFFAETRPDRTFFVASVDDYLLGIRDGAWKFIFEASTGKESLFDLANDRAEQHNVIGAHGERVHRMRQRLGAWMVFEDGFIEGKSVLVHVTKN
jgi:arylsulfatase A-like enzyme